MTSPALSIIIPTFREADSLPELIRRLSDLKAQWPTEFELLVVDDNSCDGTEEWFAKHAPAWARLIVRRSDKGLSQSVLDGMREARGDVFVVMDADLSHPPEVIPSMVDALESGADFVLGSRYIPGGTTDHSWGALRYINSKVATLLARPLTSVSDPMSGFFALPKSVYRRASHPAPLGYKIGLELLVRCRCSNVQELPIHFSNRVHGESKLTLNQQLLYLRHIARLYKFRALGE